MAQNTGDTSNHVHEHYHTEEALVQIRAALENLQTAQTMLVDKKSCTDIVNQLSGVLSRVSECRNIVARDHIFSCVRPALKSGQEKVLNDVDLIIKQMQNWPIRGGSHH